ncbi:hypothetical protein GCM10011390_24550 [Aureimonas endophytica]|uniref:Uncharacterized protein n=1 Tax=Aureimonas endophytica TaxID=2027858 RepID=A0A916ZMI3_9HYPH|nr:hypothetical protein GCM10011390_24550 [Aureimonas endophytica]
MLSRTLASFEAGLFRHFRIRRVIANIDPVFGSFDEGEDCARILRDLDPDAEIYCPKASGFAAAVARTWLNSRTELILHLEDDWLLGRTVAPDDILPRFADAAVGQVSFNHANKNWDIPGKGPFCYIKRSRRMLGVALPFKVRMPNFLTGPSFLRGDFARAAARRMDPQFDPEKQFCRGLNPVLEAFVAPYRNLILGEMGAYYIEDIGRDWRAARGIEKRIVAGRSVWHASPDLCPPGAASDQPRLAA